MANHNKVLYLVRHGQTDYNLKNIIQGRGVDSSLNDTGHQQARAFYEYHRDIAFNHILISKLQRTRQTMQPFADAGFKLEAYEQLDEIDWGHHEGRTGSHELSQEYKYITGQWREGNLHLGIPGGESPLELQARQRDFVDNILPKYSGKILICSHGRAIRSMLCTLLNEPLSKMDDFPHTNLTVYKLLGANDRWEVELFNFTDHLKNI